jgi:hypothetical protein
MTVADIVEHNRRHALTVLNDYVMRLAIALGVVATFASIFPNVTVPYLGVKVPPFLTTAVIQATLLALLLNTNNVYQYFFVMIDIDIADRWLGSLVYIAHFALVFFSIAMPRHWLTGVAALIGLIVIVNFRMYKHLSKTPKHPFLREQHTWFRRGLRHLGQIVVLAGAVEVLSSIELHEWWHGTKLDHTGLAAAQMIIDDIQTFVYAYAAIRVWQNTIRRVHVIAVANFPQQEITKMRDQIDAYLKEPGAP